MRISSSALALVLGLGCGERERPPPLPAAEQQASAQAEEAIEAPTQPTPAFVPSEQGSCPRGYSLNTDTCVHRYYRASSEPALEAALADYKRGAAPPLLAAPARAKTREPPPAKPDPGSLMRREARAPDAGSARDQRIAELDAMLALAREKLRQREEASKAKKVEDAPRARSAREGDRPEPSPPGIATAPTPGAAGASAAASDPAAARMSELANLASQLSGEQLQALTAELGKSGFNANALEKILAEARDEPSTAQK